MGNLCTRPNQTKEKANTSIAQSPFLPTIEVLPIDDGASEIQCPSITDVSHSIRVSESILSDDMDDEVQYTAVHKYL